MKKLFFLPFYFEFQSTFILLREVLVSLGFDISRRFYLLFKMGKSWDLNTTDLLKYPSYSLGFHLGCFLLKNQFTPQALCEDHDVFHVLTGFKTDTKNEIAMQYWLWGNGKRSFFVAIAMLCGIFFFPDAYSFFKKSFIKGSLCNSIHSANYQKLLSSDLQTLIPHSKNYNH